MTSPAGQTYEATIPAQTAATDVDNIVAEAPFDGVVTGVSIIPEAAVTGNDTDTRTFTLINKGQSGAGTTVVATLALETGVNLVAFDEKAFDLSEDEEDLEVTAGDVLVIAEVTPGNGLAHSGGRIQVTIAPKYA
jgi:hypothetical protein